MALRNPLDVLGFGAPRQGGFGGPAVPMAPPMPGPGFAPVTGPGGSGNVLPARYGRLDRFQQNHPRAAGFLADNSSALLHFGLGLLSGGGVPSRSWAGAQQGLAYGGSVDRERASTRKEEEEAAREAEEYAAVLDEIGLADDERRVLEMIGPEAGLPFVLERLSAQPEGPSYEFMDVNGTVVRTDAAGGTAEPVWSAPQQAEDADLPADWELYQLAIQQYPKGEQPTYDEWDLQRRGRLGGIITEDDALRAGLVEGEATRWGALQQQGTKSSAALNDLELLSELSTLAPEGPLVGRLAQMVGPGFSTAGDAFRAIVQRVAPTLRQEGSGSTSDIEYAGMLASLPQLAQSDEARQAIISIMQAKASLDLERADVVRQFLNEELTAQEARNRLSEIDRRSIMTPEMRSMFGLPSTPAADEDGWTVIDGVRIRAVQ